MRLGGGLLPSHKKRGDGDTVFLDDVYFREVVPMFVRKTSLLPKPGKRLISSGDRRMIQSQRKSLNLRAC